MKTVTGEFRLRVGPGPRFRYRPGHYGVFAPFVAMFWMVVLLVAVTWFMAKVVVFGLVVTARWFSRVTATAGRSAERPGQASKG